MQAPGTDAVEILRTTLRAASESFAEDVSWVSEGTRVTIVVFAATMEARSGEVSATLVIGEE